MSDRSINESSGPTHKTPRRLASTRGGYSYAQFKAAVRAFDRDNLLTQVAHASSLWDGKVIGSTGQARLLQPWALDGIAYVAIRWGTAKVERASPADLFKLSNMYTNLRQPELQRAIQAGNGDVMQVVERFLYEQIPHQVLGLAAIARVRAVFVDTPFPEHRTPAVFVSGWEERLLGGTLDEYLATVLLLVSYVRGNQGRWPAAGWEPELDVLTDIISLERFKDLVDTHFSASIDELKQLMIEAAQRRRAQGKPPAPDSREFNPLVARPMVVGLRDGEFVVPSVQSLEMKASLQSIVYMGLSMFGTAFTTELGYLFEAYVGRNLALFKDDRAKQERKYRNSEGNLVDSIDWILVLDRVVVLVEVKAIFPPEDTRLGVGEPMQAYGAKLEKALDQLRKTNSAIQLELPEYKDIPANLPTIGLVVTLTDFFRVPSDANSGGIPVAFVTIEELETWCGLSMGEAERVIIEMIDEASVGGDTPELRSKLAGAKYDGNAVVEEAWGANPMVALADRLTKDSEGGPTALEPETLEKSSEIARFDAHRDSGSSDPT